MKAHRDRWRETRVSLLLAALIISAWIMLHVYSLFLQPPAGTTAWLVPALVVVLCWLDVGLFIVAHDCMHGSLASSHPALNRLVGGLALLLYAGFAYDRLRRKHLAHHRRPGTPADPDFAAAYADSFVRWYMLFMRRYFGLRELTLVATQAIIYVLVLGVRIESLLLFWCLPAFLSSVQLFLFGTFLPHRLTGENFADEHRARSNDYAWLASLVTCFHFGYHHEHHRWPSLPWWKLPAARPG